MKRKAVVLSVVMGLVLFVGCASIPKSNFKLVNKEEMAEKAVIYVYRPVDGLADLVHFNYKMNEKPFKLKIAEYRAFIVNPGEHKVQWNAALLWNPELKVKTEAGKEYFINCKYNPLSVMLSEFKLKKPEVAKSKLAKCHYKVEPTNM